MKTGVIQLIRFPAWVRYAWTASIKRRQTNAQLNKPIDYESYILKYCIRKVVHKNPKVEDKIPKAKDKKTKDIDKNPKVEGKNPKWRKQ